MISPKESIAKLKRLKDFGSDRSALIRLDKNERTVPFPPEVFGQMMRSISAEAVSMYPDQTLLYKKLAKFLNIDEACLLLSPGSDAAIKMIFECYVEPRHKVVHLDPTYAMIEVYAEMFSAAKTKIGYGADLSLDFNRLLDSIDQNTRAVFIANPNQPTGTILSSSQIELLLKKTLETKSLLVIDEAYIHFADSDSAIRHVRSYPNLIVTGTFSKGFGLASVRLGYLVSDPANINVLYKVKTLSDINYFAVKLGEWLVDHFEVVKEYIDSVKEARKFLETHLPKLGIHCLAGHANFIHLKLPPQFEAGKIAGEMEKRGYLIRAAGKGLPAVLEGCVRITVGPKPQMEQFLKELQKVMVTDTVCAS